jgi:hypothetical protein
MDPGAPADANGASGRAPLPAITVRVLTCSVSEARYEPRDAGGADHADDAHQSVPPGPPPGIVVECGFPAPDGWVLLEASDPVLVKASMDSGEEVVSSAAAPSPMDSMRFSWQYRNSFWNVLRGSDIMAACLVRLPAPRKPALRITSLRAKAHLMLGRRADFKQVTIILKAGVRVPVVGLPRMELAYTLKADGSLHVDLGDNAVLPLIQSITYQAADHREIHLRGLDHSSFAAADVQLTGVPASVTLTQYADVRSANVEFQVSNILLIGDASDSPNASTFAAHVVEAAAPDLLALLHRSAPPAASSPAPTPAPHTGQKLNPGF